MKKEKTIRTYQRRTKTGKIVTVKQHTAKYDAAEALKEAAKKKGAGEELEASKKKGELDLAKIDSFKGDPNELSDKERQAWQILTGNYPAEAEPKLRKMKSLEKVWAYADAKGKKKSSAKAPKEAKSSDSGVGFTADEYKAWYHWDQDADPKNAAAKKVEKALKAKLGAKGYKKYFDEMTDSYSSRGHNKAFKGLDEKFSAGEKKSVTSGKEKSKYDPYKDLKDAYKDYKDSIKVDSSAQGKKRAAQNLLGEMGVSMQGADSKTKNLIMKIHKETGLDISKHKFYGKLPEAKEFSTEDTKSSKVKEAHASLKEKGYKRYTYNGEVYYATKSGSLKQVDEKGKVHNVVPFKGAKGTQEMALKGWKRSDAEKAKAKRDKEDAKKYRESQKVSKKAEGKRAKDSIEGLKDPKRDAAKKEMARKDREYLKGVAKKAMFKNDPWFKRNGWTKQEKRNGNYSWISPDGNVSVPVTKLGMGAGKNFGTPKIKRSKE